MTPTKYDFTDGERVTYFPVPANVDDNSHFEAIIEGFTKSGRFARITFSKLEDGLATTVNRTVPLSRLKRHGLLPV